MKKLDKTVMEETLNGFAEKKARQIFMEKFFTNGLDEGGIAERANLIPEKYVDEFLEIELPAWDTAGTEGNVRIKKISYAMGKVAEISGKHEQAAHFYRAAHYLIEAIAQAKLAGLDKLVDEWSDYYCNEFDKRNSAYHAYQLGLMERAQQYMREYLNENPDKLRYDPAFCEKMAESAARYGMNEESEMLYRKAMKMHEDKANYDSALKIAKTLKDDSKIAFYATAKWIVADGFDRGTIEQKEFPQRDKNG